MHACFYRISLQGMLVSYIIYNITGSILIEFTTEGSADNVTAMTKALCSSIADGRSYKLGSTTLTLDHYLTVDGQQQYGVICARQVNILRHNILIKLFHVPKGYLDSIRIFHTV